MVKCHNKRSKKKLLKGTGLQWGYFRILEYLAQYNSSANCQDPESRVQICGWPDNISKIIYIYPYNRSHLIKYQAGSPKWHPQEQPIYSYPELNVQKIQRSNTEVDSFTEDGTKFKQNQIYALQLYQK